MAPKIYYGADGRNLNFRQNKKIEKKHKSNFGIFPGALYDGFKKKKKKKKTNTTSVDAESGNAG